MHMLNNNEAHLSLKKADPLMADAEEQISHIS
jgi:hypothetical protein